jgi:hypothetical protein
MANPAIDLQPGPFSYFSQSVDQLGVMGGVSGSEVSPEGYLYTGFGELMFFLGPAQTPVSARVRTLEDGYLPIVSYSVEDQGIDYRFTMFEWKLQSAAGTVEIVNFVRVTVSNSGTGPRTAFLTSAMRYQAEQTTEYPTGDDRFMRPIPASGAGQFNQPGESFSKDWTYSLDGNALIRDGRILYLFPAHPAPRLSLTLHTHYNRPRPITSTRLDVQPDTPTGVAAYAVELAPGETRTLDFRMPLVPVTPGSPEAAVLEGADFDAAHQAAVAFWREIVGRGMEIDVPERKAVDTFRASLVYNLMALNVVDGEDAQTVNLFQYHRFYLRDSADLVRMYDATGYSDIAARVFSLYPSRQTDDGNFLSQPGQYDGWGEALWSIGEHFRRTRDLHFAEEFYPRVARAVAWLVKARAADPLHIMPRSDVRDNEYVAAHLTGYNFLALDGLQSAIELAAATGHSADAEAFRREYADYRATFLRLLDAAASKDGGYIPPALDARNWQGTDWGNLLSVTPEPVLDPHDPRVTKTLEDVQARYQEGIATYAEPDDGEFLHHYLTIKNTLTELVRGDEKDQEQAIREFYAELLHTSSTHTGFEYAIRPWGSRDFEGNLAPHGWFAADYRNLLRNMMVREEGDTLHLLSAVSPEWIGAGKRIEVARAPTLFGSLDFSLEMPDDASAVLRLKPSFQQPPSRIVLHLPWFMAIDSVSADGRALSADGAKVSLPAQAREIRISWHRRPDAAAMSYDKTVESYKAEYRRRYQHLLSTGEMSPLTDKWTVPEH